MSNKLKDCYLLPRKFIMQNTGENPNLSTCCQDDKTLCQLIKIPQDLCTNQTSDIRHVMKWQPRPVWCVGFNHFEVQDISDEA